MLAMQAFYIDAITYSKKRSTEPLLPLSMSYVTRLKKGIKED
jgi:hypothetical protein